MKYDDWIQSDKFKDLSESEIKNNFLIHIANELHLANQLKKIELTKNYTALENLDLD